MNYETAFLEALEGNVANLANLVKAPDFEKRLAVYQTSIFGTLQRTLYKTFKPLEALIGEAAFQELCYRYAVTHKSYVLNLNRYGADLSEFVKTAPFAHDLPYLSDFVEFCYVWQQVYLRGGEAVLIESDYPVYAIWERCQPEFVGEKTIENWQGPFQYALERSKDKVNVLHIPVALTDGVQ